MGATGGAIKKMLTDHEVDGVTAKYYENKIIDGEVPLAVDKRLLDGLKDDVEAILKSQVAALNPA